MHSRTHKYVVAACWAELTESYPQEIPFTQWENWLCWREKKRKTAALILLFPPLWASSDILPLCPSKAPYTPTHTRTRPHTLAHKPSKSYLPTVANDFFWISILISFKTGLICSEERRQGYRWQEDEWGRRTSEDGDQRSLRAPLPTGWVVYGGAFQWC